MRPIHSDPCPCEAFEIRDVKKGEFQNRNPSTVFFFISERERERERKRGEEIEYI